VQLRYVIANPSSYTYFDERRPVAFSHAGCPQFNRWKYGLTDLPAYAEGQTAAPNRLARGRYYFAYLKRLQPQGLQQQLIEVPGVGHNGEGMFTSPQGQQALFP
jgi:hypothetical protein